MVIMGRLVISQRILIRATSVILPIKFQNLFSGLNSVCITVRFLPKAGDRGNLKCDFGFQGFAGNVYGRTVIFGKETAKKQNIPDEKKKSMVKCFYFLMVIKPNKKVKIISKT